MFFVRVCVLTGDFDVPSSREDVDRDSVWNQWLIAHVHQLFVDALQAFKVRTQSSSPNMMQRNCTQY